MKLLLFALFGCYCWFCTHHYVCNIKELCTEQITDSGSRPTEISENPVQEEIIEESSEEIEEDSETTSVDNVSPDGFEIEEIDGKIIIHFPLASANPSLNNSIASYVNKLSESLKANSKSLRLVGHTDNSGDAQANYSLGLKRAEAIKAMFLANGIEESRLITESQGEKEPMVSNDTEEGRNTNRRVELIIED